MPTLRAYHGTRQLDLQRLTPSRTGEFGPGIYLADNPYTASFYARSVAAGPGAPTVLVVQVTLQAPLYLTKAEWLRKTQSRTPRTVYAALQRQGYDGIIGEQLNGQVQIVAFYPEQVVIVGEWTGQ